MRRTSRLAFVLILLLAACGQQSLSVEGFTGVAAQIVDNPKQYDGQPVTIVGYFRGQDLLDEVVAGLPPTDRLHDWVIRDNSGGIFVAGSELLPFSVASQEIWRIVRVEGTVKAHNAGTSGVQAYIVPQQIEWLGERFDYDVLPAGCIVAIHRFGGTEQLQHHLYIYENRNVAVYDAQTSWRGANKLKQIDFDKLQKAFNRAKLFDMPATVGQACQGCVRYYIAAVNEKEGIPHYVTLYEGSVPANLLQFIDLALEFAADAKPL